jgi:hypothetical protein
MASILKKIFGPVQNGDGSLRIRMNHELNELKENAEIVRFIKCRRIAWLGHLMRMDEKCIRVETNKQENQRKTKEKMD